MIFRTHIVFALFLGLIFFRLIEFNLLYFPILLIASFLPDIDSMHSFIGKKWYFRPLQWFMRHRGALHSLTYCFVFSILISFLYPLIAFPFFLGYFSHLFADALTIEGIRPFWPLKQEIKGLINTGGHLEKIIFWFLTGIDLLIVFSIFFF